MTSTRGIWPCLGVVKGSQVGVFYPQYENVDNVGDATIANLTNATLTAGDSSFLPGGLQTRGAYVRWISFTADGAGTLVITDHAGTVLFFPLALGSNGGAAFVMPDTIIYPVAFVIWSTVRNEFTHFLNSFRNVNRPTAFRKY